jgi:hypothetical protein
MMIIIIIIYFNCKWVLPGGSGTAMRYNKCDFVENRLTPYFNETGSTMFQGVIKLQKNAYLLLVAMLYRN